MTPTLLQTSLLRTTLQRNAPWQRWKSDELEECALLEREIRDEIAEEPPLLKLPGRDDGKDPVLNREENEEGLLLMLPRMLTREPAEDNRTLDALEEIGTHSQHWPEQPCGPQLFEHVSRVPAGQRMPTVVHRPAASSTAVQRSESGQGRTIDETALDRFELLWRELTGRELTRMEDAGIELTLKEDSRAELGPFDELGAEREETNDEALERQSSGNWMQKGRMLEKE